MTSEKKVKKRKRDIFTVKPVKIEQTDDDKLPILGHEILGDDTPLYGNVFLAAKTNSGKTTVMHHLLKHTVDKRTTVIIFCSTLDIDPVWVKIIEMLEAKKCKVITFDSMIDEATKVNLLEKVFKQLKEDSGDENNHPKIITELHPGIITNQMLVPEKPVPKPTTRVPKYVLIGDDLSVNELRSTAVCNALKKSRHYKCKMYLSSQHILHCSPQSFSQLSTLYLWPGFSQHYIKTLWERSNLGIDFEQLWMLYTELLKTPHDFLNINLRQNQVRLNFRPRIIDVKKIFNND